MIRKLKRRQPTTLTAVSLHDPAVDLKAMVAAAPDALQKYDQAPWEFQGLLTKDGQTPTVFHFQSLPSDVVDEVDTWAVQRIAYDQGNVLAQQRTLRRLAAFDRGLVKVEHWDDDNPVIDLEQQPSRLTEIREALDSRVRREIGGYILNASEEVENQLGK